VISLSPIPLQIFVFRIVEVWSVYLKFLAKNQSRGLKMLFCTRRSRAWRCEKVLIEKELKKTAVVNKATRTLIWCRRQLDHLTDTNSARDFRSVNGDLWWTEWPWERTPSKFVGFPLSLLFHQGAILIFHLYNFKHLTT